ncbi:NAD(P)/FAD-dependent oxidoreductase [Marinilactibacillus sp. GCM10026970]|uniref:NAD(P)/FAD-dependent oxidoreductase n=1 Tax=Marinilactibacillus sp. GCM10026970 TaxID=3252642 RepID=UPI003607A281
MKEKTIIIIGAGFSGVFTAMYLSRKLSGNNHIKIKLVNKDPYFTYKTRLHEVIGGRIRPEEAIHDLKILFKPYNNVDIIVDEVKRIDEREQFVMTKSQKISYEYLVLAMGGEPNDFGIEGVSEYGFTMWSWKEAVRIRKHILTMVEQAAKETDPKKRQAMLHFVICGGGLTGIEIMGELIEWKPQLEKNFGLQTNEISLSLVEASPTILPVLPEKESQRVKTYFAENQVNLMTEASVSKVTFDSVEIRDQEPLQTYSLIWTAGVKATSDVADLAAEFGKAGRLKTLGTMSAQNMENIYVVGDLVHYEDKLGNPLPQNAQTAEQTAKTAAENIAAELLLEMKSTLHQNKQKGTIVSVGAKYGVGYLMDLVHIKGPIAVTMKHLVNLMTWGQMKSMSNLSKYLKQEMTASKSDRYLS